MLPHVLVLALLPSITSAPVRRDAPVPVRAAVSEAEPAAGADASPWIAFATDGEVDVWRDADGQWELVAAIVAVSPAADDDQLISSQLIISLAPDCRIEDGWRLTCDTPARRLVEL